MNSRNEEPRAFALRSSRDWLWLGLRTELALFRRRTLVLSALAIVIVPSLYAIFYISSVWDPYGNLGRLPAALVNADRGATRAGHSVRLGETVVSTLEQQRPFRFARYPSAAAADAAVRRGDVYLAVIIPPEFSERAVGGRQDEPADFTLQVAEGANYTASIMSRRFGGELAHTLNERLNRERWALIAGKAGAPATGDESLSLRAAIDRLDDGGREVHEGAQRAQAGSRQLETGLDHAAAGARRLAEGTDRFAAGTVQLADGMGQIAEGIQQMRDRLPPEARLQELAAGSRALVEGSVQLAAGLDQLSAGGRQLGNGTEQLRQEAAKVPLFGRRLATGAGQLETGIESLGGGLDRAAAGGRQLQAGLETFDGGIQPLADGLRQFGGGLQTMGGRLPSAEQRNLLKKSAGELRDGGAELATGLGQLREGSSRLSAGSSELERGTAEMAGGLARLRAGFTEALGEADASGLAAPVRVIVQRTAPVPNNGAAFAPYFAALSLWVGGIMMTFVFYFHHLIAPMRGAPRAIRWLAKAAVPLALGLVQATVIVAVLRLAFGIAFAHPGLVWLAAILGSLAFVSVILLLITVLGDAGRLLAVVLLILQLAAAGGIYPVELSGRFYQTIHPFLPFTALVTAFRATMFATYDGAWLGAGIQLIGTGLGAALLAIWLARWKYVPSDSYGPAVEF